MDQIEILTQFDPLFYQEFFLLCNNIKLKIAKKIVKYLITIQYLVLHHKNTKI